jgi:hypothetical protein
MPRFYVGLSIFIVTTSFIIKDLNQSANFEYSELIIHLTANPKSPCHWKLKNAVNVMADTCLTKKFVTTLCQIWLN